MRKISRKEAKEKKLIYYYTGIPCINGHISKRLTRIYTCYQCERDRYKIYKRTELGKKTRKTAKKKYKSGSGKFIEAWGSRLNSYLKAKGFKKETSLRKYICLSPSQLRSYIENQFNENMNWDNYGSYWHLDHIVPISYFDPSDINQLKIALNYNNLAPLEAKKNILKSNKFTKEDLDLLLKKTGLKL